MKAELSIRDSRWCLQNKIRAYADSEQVINPIGKENEEENRTDTIEMVLTQAFYHHCLLERNIKTLPTIGYLFITPQLWNHSCGGILNMYILTLKTVFEDTSQINNR